DGKHDVPYSVVAALDPNHEPLRGVFLPAGAEPLRDDEILLVDRPESPLEAKPGEKITLIYYQLDQHAGLERRSATHPLRPRIPLTGLADDPDLTPEFRGITDKLDIRNWENPPFPYDNSRITPADEHYWNRYRATPKAYITLAKGQQRWGSRYGRVTSIHLHPFRFNDAIDRIGSFRLSLTSQWLKPEQGGMV